MWEYGIVHLSIILFSFYSFGFWYGILFIGCIIFAIDFIIDKLGYQRMVFGDLVMSYEFPNKNHNIGGYFLIKKLEFEEFKSQIQERGITPIRKLRQIQLFQLWSKISNIMFNCDCVHLFIFSYILYKFHDTFCKFLIKMRLHFF